MLFVSVANLTKIVKDSIDAISKAVEIWPTLYACLGNIITSETLFAQAVP